MNGDSMNFFNGELQYMTEHPNKRAMDIGKREPYYLTYLKKGLPNPKPKPREVENAQSDRDG